MYRVLDVCRYIINYSNSEGYGVSNLKLQKLLYFIQVYFLLNSEKQEPCFSEKIEAWDFGPVVPVAYHEYKQYGSTDIPPVDSYIEYERNDPWSASRIEYNEDCILDKDKELINTVIKELSKYSATDLVTISHNQTPWKNAYVQYGNKEITISSMREYFNEK